MDANAHSTAAPPSRRLAIFLCAVPACYFLVVAGYAVWNYPAYASDLPRFLRYVAGPTLVALLLIGAAYRLSAKRGAYLGLTASAALIALFLVELLLSARLLFAMAGTVSLLGAGDTENGELTRGHGGLPPMYTSKQVSSQLGVERLENAILGGLPNSEVLLCAHNGAPLYYTADRFGFNNDDSIYETPLDIVVVGDSFVEGHCQPAQDTLVGRLRQDYPNSAGMGMRAAGPLLELAFLGRYAARLEPDYVVMAFFEGNDWQNLSREKVTPWLRESLDANADFGPMDLSEQQIEATNTVIEQWWETQVSQGDIFRKSSILRNVIALNEVWGLLGLDYPRVAPEQPVYDEVLARAREMTESWGGQFVLLYIPVDARYRGLLDKSFVYDRLRNQVLEAAAANGIEVIDLAQEFGDLEDPTAFYAPDAHFNAEGNEVAAQAIARWIASSEPPGQE